MNNFEPKYIKLASSYLSEKLGQLHISKEETIEEERVAKKEVSRFQKIVATIFK